MATKDPQIPVISSLQAPGPGSEDLKRQDKMDSTSADVAEDSKEASAEAMEVAVSEEDLEDTMVARSRPRKLNDSPENSSETSKKRGE